jgi:8-oxo-dGTP pyrophosphatase MutT (NUDIX family)
MIITMTDFNNPQIIKHRYAATLLIAEDGRMIGQHRDNNPEIDNPNQIGTFGGTVESKETPSYSAWRELVKEETNLKFDEADLIPFLEDKGWRELTKEWELRYFFYVKISNEQLDRLEIYEGQGWAEIKGSDDPMLVNALKPVIEYFQTLNSLSSQLVQ